MGMTRRHSGRLAATAFTLALAAPGAAAQEFPPIPVSIIAFEAPAFAIGEDGLPHYRYNHVRHDTTAIADEGEYSIEVSEDGLSAVETVVVDLALAGAAETRVSVAQSAVGNVINQDGVTLRNAIEGSFNANRGIVGVNQSSGDVNNQANVTAIAIGNAGLADVGVAVTQELVNNQTTVVNGARENRIVDSFNDTVGIVGVNQAAGNMNLQSNVVAIALGVGPGPVPGLISMSDFSLDQISSGNTADIDDETKAASANTLTNSFNNFAGIAQVNQAAGDGNIMAKVVAISINVVNP